MGSFELHGSKTELINLPAVTPESLLSRPEATHKDNTNHSGFELQAQSSPSEYLHGLRLWTVGAR